MGLFDKFKKERNSTPATLDYNPRWKDLSWFSSEVGLESYKKYITAQNFMLEETYKQEYEEKFSQYPFNDFLYVSHKEATLPWVYFQALVNAIDVRSINISAVNEAVVKLLEYMTQPYVINDDGEPEACEVDLSPEQIVSTEKNPLLNFITNFNVFEIQDDVLGSMQDKYTLYRVVIMFLAINAKDIVMDENQWLFDKNTYLNEFGTVRKEKGFLNKCKELSNFPEYFESLIAELG